MGDELEAWLPQALVIPLLVLLQQPQELKWALQVFLRVFNLVTLIWFHLMLEALEKQLVDQVLFILVALVRLFHDPLERLYPFLNLVGQLLEALLFLLH